MKDEAFRETHQYKNPAPVLLLQHTKETTFAAKAHWHDDLEISLLFKGLVRCYVGGKVKDVTDGRTCLVNSGEVHSTVPMFNGTDRSAPGITLLVKYDFVASIIPNYDKIMFAIPNVTVEKEIAVYLFEIADLYQNQKDVKASIEILGLVCKILCILLDTSTIERSSVDVNYWKDSERQKIILDYIHSNYNQPLKQGELADKFHFSKEYFCRFFKQYTGQTFKEYLTGCRLVHAEQMLRNSGSSILEIAQCSGFTDEQAFIRAFKNQYKETPGKYRKNVCVGGVKQKRCRDDGVF